MHAIEPHYNWRHLYTAEEDERSPFYGREYSEFEFSNKIYNFVLHPQWDDMGSPTLFIKILFVDYDEHYAIIELIGEWNDAINNDIMFLKRDIMDELMVHKINKFILIGENVLNFHYSDDSYYEEWYEDVEDGFIVFLNFQQHVLAEFHKAGIDNYFISGGEFDDMAWRGLTPSQLFQLVEKFLPKRLK
jgi:hypothetical protein